MEDREDVDWPRCAHSRTYADLDRAAQCSICHAVFDTPLSLLCGHSCECLYSKASDLHNPTLRSVYPCPGRA